MDGDHQWPKQERDNVRNVFSGDMAKLSTMPDDDGVVREAN